jgi:TetR/AcrR family transcriptional regulator, transcriptional repressor for nem operon
MRKSKAEAAETREAIVAAAADHLRRSGIADSSLADMMAAAGLTQGGFYRHFRDKEQLVAEGLSVAGAKTIAIIRRNIEKGGMRAAVDGYLSRTHRDAAMPICPFAALGSEIARSSDEVKAAAGAVLEELFVLFSNGDSAPGARAEAIVALCTLVGAMTLSRVTANTRLSDEILRQAKHHLHELT